MPIETDPPLPPRERRKEEYIYRVSANKDDEVHIDRHIKVKLTALTIVYLDAKGEPKKELLNSTQHHWFTSLEDAQKWALETLAQKRQKIEEAMANIIKSQSQLETGHVNDHVTTGASQRNERNLH